MNRDEAKQQTVDYSAVKVTVVGVKVLFVEVALNYG